MGNYYVLTCAFDIGSSYRIEASLYEKRCCHVQGAIQMQCICAVTLEALRSWFLFAESTKINLYVRARLCVIGHCTIKFAARFINGISKAIPTPASMGNNHLTSVLK